ncbi:hypothetical protein PFISCL1PPCAC_16875, partial [Pristionchus fissidentatus]
LEENPQNENEPAGQQEKTVEEAQRDDEVGVVPEHDSDDDFDDDDEDWMRRGAAILVRKGVDKTTFEKITIRDTVTEVYHICCYILHDGTHEAHRNCFGLIHELYAGQKGYTTRKTKMQLIKYSVIVSGDFNCTLEEMYNVCVEIGVELEDRLLWEWVTSVGNKSPIPSKIDYVLTSNTVLVNVHKPSRQTIPGHSCIFWDRYSTKP